MFQYHLVKGGVVAVGDEFLGFLFVEAASFFEQTQEGAAAVVEMGQPMLDLGRAKRMNVEADIFAMSSVTGPFENANLIERYAQIGAAERLVLVKLQAVLVVQVQRPQ